MKNEKYRILLVDDDPMLCELLSEYLQEDGFDVASLNSGEEAIATLLSDEQFDAVVLDIMMPVTSGLDVLREVRSKRDIPILMLTGRGDDIDRILGLEMGADDYLGKPCNPRELVARIRAVLRRSQQQTEAAPAASTVDLHGICLDSGARSVTVNGRSLVLTSAEFNALKLLMSSAGETLTKQDITEQVLNRKLEAFDRSMDVHISRIRQKLAAEGVSDVIKSIRGVGYQMLTDS